MSSKMVSKPSWGTPNISVNFSIHIHTRASVKHKTTLLHQKKGLSSVISGLSVWPKWMPREMNKARTSMYVVSPTYSPCFLLLEVQGLPEPDIFPTIFLISLDLMIFLISDSLLHWDLFISRTFSIYNILCWGAHARQKVSCCFAGVEPGTHLFHLMAPHSCVENWKVGPYSATQFCSWV